MRLKDKVAIIAGAGQTAGEGMGNGRATAIAFAREGAKLVLANRSLASLEETRRIIEAEGFAVDCVATDVRDEAACAALIEAAVARHGRVDVLHNNVGVNAFEGDTAKVDRAAWDEVLDINLTGAMLLSKHVLPVMRKQKSGCITHVSSHAAISAVPVVAYKVSKAALNELTRWLAFENAPYNIRCNALLLGLIDTPMAIEGFHAATGQPRETLRAERDGRVPLGRMGTPWETAALATFLASDEAAYVTGALLPVDGGMLTRVG